MRSTVVTKDILQQFHQVVVQYRALKGRLDQMVRDGEAAKEGSTYELDLGDGISIEVVVLNVLNDPTIRDGPTLRMIFISTLSSGGIRDVIVPDSNEWGAHVIHLDWVVYMRPEWLLELPGITRTGWISQEFLDKAQMKYEVILRNKEHPDFRFLERQEIEASFEYSQCVQHMRIAMERLLFFIIDLHH